MAFECTCEAMWSGRDDQVWRDCGCPSCTCIFEGSKVRIKGDETKAIYTVAEYDDNICGDGCCSGYRLEGYDQRVHGYDRWFWESDLELVV